MDANTLTELESLLEEALQHVSVRSGQEPLSQNRYRDFLRQGRRQYNLSVKMQLQFCRVVVQQPDIQNRLLNFLRQELADYIRDDRIHSATINLFGGLTSGSPLEDVSQNLVKRAIVDGPAAAAQALLSCTSTAICHFYAFFLLPGLLIENTTELFDGVTLVRLPSSQSDLPPHLPLMFGDRETNAPVTVQDLLEKTLARFECQVSPIFHRPEESYTFDSGPEKHFSVKLKGDEFEDFNLGVLWQALGVASRRSVNPTMSWSSLLDYEVFDLSTTWGIGGGGYGTTLPVFEATQSAKLTKRQLETIPALYRALTRPGTDTWNTVRIPIERWMKSLQQSDPTDQLIDIAIALESLYVTDSRGEVSFRFALHAAWHLGKDKKERRDLQRFFSKLYQARSDIVHTGSLRRRTAKDLPDLAEAVTKAQDLCWQGIDAVLTTGKKPDWASLVLGDDMP